ncbi:Ig-like domain-containing protein [Flavobacterium chungangensis]|uniref:Ig-like domain-containing protein n=1 Tax=Flavobacterium chungangensis TaxID=2708132 RepID=A0ABV8ZDI3_9FLAO
MKKTLLLFFLLPFLTFAQNVDLIKWRAETPSDPKKPTVNPAVNATVLPLSYLSSSNDPSKVNVEYTSGWEEEPFFLCKDWPNGEQNEGDINLAKYVEFKVTPDSGKKLDLTLFKMTFRSQGGGESEKFTILYSKDSEFKKDVKVLVPERASVNNWTSIDPPFSEEINPVLPGQVVYIRLYVYNSYNNFHIKTGNVNTSTTITGAVSSFDPNKILAINDFVKAIKNVEVNISPLNNDIKKENVTSMAISSPPPASAGTAILNPDNTVSFIPANNFTGTTSFKYTIKDAANNSSEATVKITVAEETPEPLVIWYGRNESNRLEATPLSPYVTSGNILYPNTYLWYDINEDKKNPFFHTGSWPSGAADNSKYLEFTIKADNTHRVNLTTFNFMFRNQGGSGQKFKINYSDDATFTTNVKTLLAETSTSGTWRSISAPFASDLNSLTPGKAIFIRLYIYNSNEEFHFRTKVNIAGNIKDSNVFIAYSDFATTPSNKSISIPVLANDVVGNTPVQNITVTQPTSGGTVVVNGTTDITFTPTPGFVGTSNFTYSIFNGTIYSSATVSVDVTAAPCTPTGDQTAFGPNTWIGYVYKMANNAAMPPNISYPALPNTSIATYIGIVTENKNFDRNIGGGSVTGQTSNFACDAAPSDRFFVRYKMLADITEAGVYSFDIGSDDGVRLYIDDAAVPVITRWNGHGFTMDYATQNLTVGQHKFVLEYYEDGGDSRVSFFTGIQKGNPTEYGDKVWNVYGYVNNDITLQNVRYAGYYVDPHLNPDSTNYWTKDKSPSSATIWQGSQIPDNNFTVVYKRKGFDCGLYQLKHMNHDDAIQLYIDDKLIFSRDGWDNTTYLINGGDLYPLNSESRVEIRLREDGGDANLGINFTKTDIVYNGTGTIPNGSSLVISSNTELKSDLTVCSCTVNPNITLTVPKDVTLTVDENINVGEGGKLLILDGGSFLQTSTSKNMFTGSDKAFEIQRITEIRRFDLTYWSSPVDNPDFKMSTLSPETLFDKFFYWTSDFKWATDLYGKKTMEPGKGYSIRGPQSFDTQNPSNFTGKFYGKPNNGNILIPITPDKYHFVGNPYPSAIDARKFIRDNGEVGPLYFWTHISPPKKENGSNTYTYSSPDYAVLTLLGSTKATTGGEEPSGYIGVGQGFFIKPRVTSVTFTNEQRVKAQNTQFYKTTAKETEVEVNRLWLNLSNTEDAFKQLLVGYAEGASNSYDHNYDATTMSGNSFIDFYTINEAKKLTVQARALPFDNTDTVPLGYKTTVSSELTISIDHADGFFNKQAVYLEDKTTGTITDLRASNYTFKTAAGTFTDRFVLRYTNKTLGTDDFENVQDGVLVSIKSKVINAVSETENIKEVQIYTIGGQLLYNKSKIDAKELEITNLHSSNQVLLVKVILENGHVVTKKIIFN